MPAGSRTVQSVDTACRILDALESLDGAGVTELADHLGQSKGAVHTQLATLAEHGFVVNEDGTYRLSLRLLELGEYTRRSVPMYDVATPKLDELAEDTGTRAQLVIEEAGQAVPVYIARPQRALAPPTGIGERECLHCIASGKAMLASLPESRVDEIVDEHGLPARTSETITTRAELDEELARICERGVALNDEEKVPGLRSVGAAIRGQDGSILGAISVSGPTSGLEDEAFREEIPTLVSNAANVIEVNHRAG